MTAMGPMAKAVVDALKDAQTPPRDGAAVQLVRRYGQLLDEARGGEDEAAVYGDLGPKMLAALTALGMTAAGRGAKGGGPVAGPVASELDKARARRAKRAG